MREYKTWSNKELAAKVVEYIERTEQIKDLYLKDNLSLNENDRIKSLYALLKKELKEDHKYLDKVRNMEGSADLYERFFWPAIMEAAVWGFSAKIGSKENEELFESLDEAYEKFTKFLTLEQWKQISETGEIPKENGG